jgi:hypothetical protein
VEHSGAGREGVMAQGVAADPLLELAHRQWRRSRRRQKTRGGRGEAQGRRGGGVAVVALSPPPPRQGAARGVAVGRRLGGGEG